MYLGTVFFKKIILLTSLLLNIVIKNSLYFNFNEKIAYNLLKKLRKVSHVTFYYEFNSIKIQN
jgi:hypothetical protein